MEVLCHDHLLQTPMPFTTLESMQSVVPKYHNAEGLLSEFRKGNLGMLGCLPLMEKTRKEKN